MLDFNTIKAMVDNDQDVIMVLLATYLEDYGDCVDKISTLVESHDWHELFLFSHSLKGTLKIIGEDSVTQRLENIEHAARQNQAPLNEDLEHAKSELAAIQSQIQHYLANENAYE